MPLFAQKWRQNCTNTFYAILWLKDGQQLHIQFFGYHPAQIKPLWKIVPKGHLINIELLVQLIKPVL